MSESPHRIHVFVSYSHSNAAQKNLLVRALEDVKVNDQKRYDVRYDTGHEKLPEDTHREISNNINWADIIIPIVSKEWLQSHECRDELVRAHERRKRIIPFRAEDVSEDGPDKVPFFLHEQLFVTWNQRNITAAIDDLLTKLESIGYLKWKHEYYRLVRKAGDIVANSSPIPRWKANLISNRVLAHAVEMIESIVNSKDCSFDIAPESNYLHFADPIFANSQNIIAICIARISTFWSNPDFRVAASNYLGKQKVSADSIARLFVFESADEVNSYKNILQAHFEHYGRKPNCGVFFCSALAYKKLSERWEKQFRMGEDAFTEDFGLLSFDDTDLAMEAALTKNQFRYREYNPAEEIRETKNLLIREYFQRFLNVSHGEILKELEVARWSDAMWREPSKLAQSLEQLFANRGGGIRHYVCIKESANQQEVERCIYDLLYSLSSKKDMLKIIDVSVDRRISLQTHDGRFGGILRTAHDFEYILKIEFLNEEALRHFYSHELHSIERENLYTTLWPDIIPLYDRLKTLPQDERQEQAKIFQEIEDTLTQNNFIRRYDVKDDEPFTSIVRKPGIPFVTYKK